MHIHLHVHEEAVSEVTDRLDVILKKLNLILHKEDHIMSVVTDALDQAEAAATANASADDSAEKLLVALSQQIADLKTNTTDPATVARISALATAINSRAAQLAAAVVAGTPAAPAV